MREREREREPKNYKPTGGWTDRRLDGQTDRRTDRHVKPTSQARESERERVKLPLECYLVRIFIKF